MDLDIGGLMIGNGSDVLENKATLETCRLNKEIKRWGYGAI